MGIFSDSLDKANRQHLHPPPVQVPSDADAPFRQNRQGHPGRSRTPEHFQRTLERYLTGQIKKTRPELAARLTGNAWVRGFLER